MVAGAGGYWYFDKEGMNPDALHEATGQIAQGAEKLKSAMGQRFQDWSAESIKEELAKSGVIIRDKAAQASVAFMDATADARITGKVKSKLLADSLNSAWNINVDTADGLVTLSGKAANHERVAQAVKLALETDGVIKVISTIQVAADSQPASSSERMPTREN